MPPTPNGFFERLFLHWRFQFGGCRVYPPNKRAQSIIGIPHPATAAAIQRGATTFESIYSQTLPNPPLIRVAPRVLCRRFPIIAPLSMRPPRQTQRDTANHRRASSARQWLIFVLERTAFQKTASALRNLNSLCFSARQFVFLLCAFLFLYFYKNSPKWGPPIDCKTIVFGCDKIPGWEGGDGSENTPQMGSTRCPSDRCLRM